MDEITIRVKNNTFLTVDCEDKGILHELSEFFTFFVPGYRFIPSFKNKMWDGKIRLLNMRNQEVYAGLYQYIVQFCKERDIPIVVEDSNSNYYNRPDLEYNDNVDWIHNLPISSGGKKISPRDYQEDAVSYALKYRRGLLISPTGSGKSLIIYLIMRYFLEYNDKDVLIIVPTTSLVKQMSGDFDDYSQFDETFNAQDMCHQIMAGADKGHKTKRVFVSTWQSIYKMPAGYFQKFGMVVGDEAHNFKAKSLTSILDKCTEAKYRFGLTGTLDGSQTHKLVLEGLFGPINNVTTSKTLIDRGDLADISIDIILIKHPEEMCKHVNKMKYQDEIDYLVSYTPRNNFIKNLAVDQNGNTLVLFNYVEKHGVPLYRMIRETAHKNRKVFFVSGKTDADVREEIRAVTETEKNAILVCSFGTFSTGINIKNLHNIIFASPSKSQVRILQSIGRGLRKSDRATKIYDIADDIQWKRNKNFTLKHSADRIKIYAKEKFKFKIHEVKL
jgi:superfamily II DNA or RNA helicase